MTSSELRLARQALGWTQEELAARLGIARHNLTRWERGGRIAHPRMLGLAIAALRIEQLLEYTTRAAERSA